MNKLSSNLIDGESDKLAIKDPNEYAKSMLQDLVELFSYVFKSSIEASSGSLKLKQDEKEKFLEWLNEIRGKETNFGERTIEIEGIRDEEEMAELQKNCFWINLFNFAILARVLEFYI